MRRFLLFFTVATALAAMPAIASAQTMPLNDFIRRADRIPRNVTALLHLDFRRLKREGEAAISVVLTDQYRAQQAGRPSQTCIPMEGFTFEPEDILRRLKAIPEPRRRRMTTTDGIREIMRQQYPCAT